MKVKTSLDLDLSTAGCHWLCITERTQVSSFKYLRICPQTPYMQILFKCVNKTSSVFSKNNFTS